MTVSILMPDRMTAGEDGFFDRARAWLKTRELPKIDGKDIEGDQGANQGDEAISKSEVEVAFFGDTVTVEKVRDTDRIRDNGDAEREDKNGDEAFVAKLQHVWCGVFPVRPGMEQG